MYTPFILILAAWTSLEIGDCAHNKFELTQKRRIRNMLKAVIEKALNKQIELEASSSQFYLSMASWAESQGLSGTSSFLYKHSDEERLHMLKLVKFINERGGAAIIPALIKPPTTFQSLSNVFESLLEHELNVTESINNIVGLCLDEKDFTTHNFMQWYVSEQLEEEAMARTILDKLNMIGNDKAGLYLFDRDLNEFDPVENVV